MDTELISVAGLRLVLLVFGTTFGAVKVAMNGARKDIAETRREMRELSHCVTGVKVDVANLRGQIDRKRQEGI